MKKIIKKLISSILLCAVLAGCSNSAASPDPSQPYDGYVSPLRTGTMSQGIRNWANNFECTETGSYFMCGLGTTWLLYVDHGSDDVIKLCGRPDCNHTGQDCNAFFISAQNICYYNGFLYTFDDDPFGSSLIRMNLDGTERVNVYNTSSFEDKNGFDGRFDRKILNGVFMATLTRTDEKGQTVAETCYYKLDGSMDEPKFDTFIEMFMKSDGENIVGIVDYEKENNLYVYGIWEPEKGVVAELFKSDDIRSFGYIGVKAEYYIEDGIIIENSYAEGKKELLDTGLKGNYQLVCFPDCMVVYEYIPTGSGITLEEATLHFYSWDCNDLGSVKINYKFHEGVLGAGLICGETPERIFLMDNIDAVPRYYINKSDLGTGKIEIHPFKLPEGMQSEFMEGDKHEENN